MRRARALAVRRALRFINDLARDPSYLQELSTGLLYLCRSIATTSPDRELAFKASQLGRYAFDAWRAAAPRLDSESSPALITDYVRAYHAAQAFGVRSQRARLRLRALAKTISVDDFLGFDPKREPPPSDLPYVCNCGHWSTRGRRICSATSCGALLQRMTRYGAWCHAFTAAFCGERYGVRLGASYIDVLRWLPAMRPYKTTGRHSARQFYEAAYAITHVVYTLNDYGRYYLCAHWLPWEYEFLRTHLQTAISINDADMVGEFLDALRAFAVPDSEQDISLAFQYLVDSQNSDGSWGDWHVDSLYTGFHATWAALDGLRDFSFSGPKLTFPSLLPCLERWAIA